jgi:predicted membrane protein
MEDNKPVGSRVVLGSVLILVGVLFLARTAGMITLNLPYIIFSFPFILSVVGILILVNSRKRTLGAIFFVVGIFFLIPRIFPFIYYDDDIIFPIIIILLGCLIVFKQRSGRVLRNRRESIFENHDFSGVADDAKQFGKKIADEIKYKYHATENMDYIDDIAIFGGGHKVIQSDNFKGGNITAIFGGSEIDLTQCKLAEGDNVLDVVIIFGGTEIIVPKDWNIRTNVTPLFGGFSNKSRRDASQPLDTTRTLVIKGLALFGGGEIKSYY